MSSKCFQKVLERNVFKEFLKGYKLYNPLFCYWKIISVMTATSSMFIFEFQNRKTTIIALLRSCFGETNFNFNFLTMI